jgi:hypothetical protein
MPHAGWKVEQVAGLHINTPVAADLAAAPVDAEQELVMLVVMRHIRIPAPGWIMVQADVEERL